MKEGDSSTSDEQVRIKRVGVLSVAFFLAVISFIIGFLISVPVAFLSDFISSVLPEGVTFFGVVTGVKALLILPPFYALIGFLIGSLLALLYNLGALITKGIKLYS